MITTQDFNTMVYSNESLFDKSGDRVALKRYRDDLLFYTSFDGSLNANYSIGNPAPTTTGSNATENFGVFAQNVSLQGSVKYSYDNFVDLKNEGSVKFRFKTNFNYGTCYQNTLSSFSTIITQTYSFELFINNVSEKVINVALTAGMTIGQILGALVLTENLGSTSVSVINITGDKLKFYTEIPGDYIEVKNSGANSLLSLFGGVDTPVLPNAPTVDMTVLALTNETNNNNKLEFIHTATSNLVIRLYDKNGALVVNKDFGLFSNSYFLYYAMEIAWSDNLLLLFVNGRIYGVASFDSLDRDAITTKLVLTGSVTNPYRIDELIVFNTTQNFKNYTVESAALTPYTTLIPYVDIDFGTGYIENEVKDLNLKCSINVNFVVKLGTTWYYYFSGSWRTSDGSYAQSVVPGVMETKFGELFFSVEAPLTVRAYFYSDGLDESYLDEISIIMERGDEQPAVVIGTIDLSAPVNLVVDKNITITTQEGTSVVDVSSGAGNAAAVTMQEIKNAINAAVVPGLALAKDDGYGHLVLETSALGAGTFISVSEGSTLDALNIVWGYEATDTGEVADTSINIDYSPLYDYVRTSLGAPIVPVELTDGQLSVCLQEAVYEFNRWKNFKENIYYTTLAGNERDGYEIPPIVGGQDNIIDVIVKPRLPFGYFSTSADAAANIFVQYFFNKYGKPGANGFLTDYSLMISFQKDMGLILGTEPRWYVLNNKLFLQPRPSSALAVGIEYRASLSIDEIVNSILIKRFVTAKAKILLGNIRGTFGGSIPGGAENIQLNSAEMISQGSAELEAVKAEMKGQAEPLMFTWG